MSLRNAKAVQSTLNALTESRFLVRSTVDREEIADALVHLEKHYKTPALDPDHNDFDGVNAEWFLVEFDGRVCACVAYRVDTIPEGSLASFLRRQNSRGYGSPRKDAFSMLREQVVNRLSGRLAYIGELMIKKGTPNGLAEKLMAFLHCYIIANHDPDYCYAFIKGSDITRHADLSFGFSTRIGYVKSWPSAPRGRAQDEFLCYNDRDLARFFIDGVALRHDQLLSTSGANGEAIGGRDSLPIPLKRQ